jgi:hypothetical protein
VRKNVHDLPGALNLFHPFNRPRLVRAIELGSIIPRISSLVQCPGIVSGVPLLGVANPEKMTMEKLE